MINKNPIVLIRGDNLSDATQLALTFVEARRYFTEFSLPQPPLPNDVSKFIGCNFLITETEGTDGARLGKVTLLTPSGEVRYERDWIISNSSN